MIKINKNHKSIKENINSIKPNSSINKIVATGLIISNLFIYSGCNKTIKCGVKEEHAHFYTYSSDSPLNPTFGRYINSDKEWKESSFGIEKALWRTDNYILVDKEQSDLLTFANKNQLFRFDENSEIVDEVLEGLEDHIEYEVDYQESPQDIPPFILDPNLVGMNALGSFTMKSRISNDVWTTESDAENLTGTRRLCKYTFNAYKIEKDSNGKYVLLKSDDVDSFSDLPEGYDYFKWNSAERFYHEEYIYDEESIEKFESSKVKSKGI
jgi:hypothetical protein